MEAKTENEQILEALNSGNTVQIEQEKLPEFWAHCKASHNLYSFRYDYTEFHVNITQTPDTILRVKSHESK